MKYENEITVEVDTDLESLKKILLENSFVLKEEYDVIDIYMLKNDINPSSNYLELLKECVLVRNIIDKNQNLKMIVYKYKEYNEKEEIIRQAKVSCEVNSVEEAVELLEVIGYHKLIRINDHSLIYANNDTEMAIQMVNDKHIYIEIEDKCNYIDKRYASTLEMIKDFCKYNIPIKGQNYFVKKAVIELEESGLM